MKICSHKVLNQKKQRQFFFLVSVNCILVRWEDLIGGWGAWKCKRVFLCSTADNLSYR